MNLMNKQTGFNLIELMISIVIGSFLILGATYAFQQAKNTYITNDNVARLYEQAQYVLDLVEEDIRLSNYWGLHNKRAAITGDNEYDSSGTANTTGLIVPAASDCPNGWALDLRTGISGTDHNTAVTPTPNWATSGTSS